MNKSKWFVVILGLIVVVGGIVYLMTTGVGMPGGKPSDNASSTTDGAKPLHGGEAEVVSSTWKTSVGDGITFSYPATLGMNFITAKSWPPAAYLLNLTGPVACTAGGTETSKTGVTAQTTIKGHVYCVTKQSTVAAANTTTTYIYTFTKDNKVVALLTTLRYIACGNYPAAQKATCEAERKSFNFDLVADGMAQSVKFSKIEAAPTNIVPPKGS